MKPVAKAAFERIGATCAVAVLMLPLAGCQPEVGSERWCADMKEKSSGDWSLNEAKDFARHCVIVVR